MRIISVVARQFGPFTEKTLECAEGLTLVWGANEAGKSSWHAALYAGLCGVRRGRGASRSEDRAFRDRHRPWDGDAWTVELLLDLADGRRIRLQHDLDGTRESRVWDDALGRDVAAEITHDGMPDASRWLGLDRRTFLAVACVRQGEILAVRDESEVLRDYLQRAAASAGSDGTAAAAIARIEDALGELVGTERAGSTKPLRRALDRVARAEAALGDVRGAADQYRQALDEAEARREEADAAERKVIKARLARALLDRTLVRSRVDRIRELLARHPAGAPVRTHEDSLIEEVAGALRAWETRPEELAVEGPAIADLQEQLDALPEAPTGDFVVHESVIKAHRTLGRANQAVELHDSQQPLEAGRVSAESATIARLREYARSLDQEVPPLDASLETRRRLRQADLDRRLARQKWGRAAVAVAALSGIGGIVAVQFDQLPVAIGLFVLTSGALVWWVSQAGRAAEIRLINELRDIDSQLADQRHRISQLLRQQQSARDEAEARGISPDAEAMHSVVARLEAEERGRTDHERWAQLRLHLSEGVTAAEHALEATLVARGVDVSRGLDAAIKQYEESCLQRLRQAASAGRRAGLQRELAAREALERARSDARARREAADQDLRRTGERCGISGRSGDDLVTALRNWQAERLGAARQFEQDSRDWAELEHLLGGATPEQVEREAQETSARVSELRKRLGAEADLAGDLDEMAAALPRLETLAQQASETAAEARGRAAQLGADLGSIVESEEELAAAEAELARVRRLESTLRMTLEHLIHAQERVHRDLAPVLAGTMRNWLETITDGRYVDVRVDPESLEITVCDPAGRWRSADRLSQGTTEQIYLALRLAMALHLTPRAEPCPLIFDEVTVQSDSPRSDATLRTLHQLSAEHQVILFSQEQHVLEWVGHHATSRDSVVRLDPPPFSKSWQADPSRDGS